MQGILFQRQLLQFHVSCGWKDAHEEDTILIGAHQQTPLAGTRDSFATVAAEQCSHLAIRW